MDNEKIREAEDQVAVWDIGLTMVQLTAGILSSSVIMLADSLCSAYHAFGGIREGETKKAKILTVLLTVLFLMTGIILSVINVRRIYSGSYASYLPPGIMVILVCAGSILVKRIICRYLLYLALEYSSSVLVADAWRQKEDMNIFWISFAGLCLAKTGIVIGEPITSVILCVIFIRRVLLI